jgi:undecaprenyl-diphosphatase
MAESKTQEWFSKVDDWDFATCLYINGFCRQPMLQMFFALVSRLGDGMFWYGLAIAIPLIFGADGFALSALMLGTGAVCAVIYKQLKVRLVRERPFIRSHRIFRGCAPLDRYSFPSGHTMHAVCFSTVVIWHCPVLAWVLLPFTLLVALSRMVLGMHYPTDVICGAVLGFLLGCLANSLVLLSRLY